MKRNRTKPDETGRKASLGFVQIRKRPWTKPPLNNPPRVSSILSMYPQPPAWPRAWLHLIHRKHGGESSTGVPAPVGPNGLPRLRLRFVLQVVEFAVVPGLADIALPVGLRARIDPTAPVNQVALPNLPRAVRMLRAMTAAGRDNRPQRAGHAISVTLAARAMRHRLSPDDCGGEAAEHLLPAQAVESASNSAIGCLEQRTGIAKTDRPLQQLRVVFTFKISAPRLGAVRPTASDRPSTGIRRRVFCFSLRLPRGGTRVTDGA